MIEMRFEIISDIPGYIQQLQLPVNGNLEKFFRDVPGSQKLVIHTQHIHFV